MQLDGYDRLMLAIHWGFFAGVFTAWIFLDWGWDFRFFKVAMIGFGPYSLWLIALYMVRGEWIWFPWDHNSTNRPHSGP